MTKVFTNKENKGPVFATEYDPRLPSITSLQAKHWRARVAKNRQLSEVFSSPPLTAFERQPNLRSHIIRARVVKAPQKYPHRSSIRTQKGMTKCNQINCTVCSYIREGKNITINGAHWNIQNKVSCPSTNIVYDFACKKYKCRMVYLGETKRQLKFCLSQHRG